MNYMLLISLMVLSLGGCGKSGSKAPLKPTAFKVRAEQVQNPLYFTGTIEPLQEQNVASPMAATVEIMHRSYGQQVEKGELLFTLNSADLQKQFNEMLTQYLKAKDLYFQAKAKFVGTTDLWKAGLVAKNNYFSEQSSKDAARLSFLQARQSLTELLDKVQVKMDFSKLSLGEFEKVNQLLNDQHHRILIKAPASGLFLYPPKSLDSKASELRVGSKIEAGQTMGLIGDLTGIKIQIAIAETDLLKINPGMKALVTSLSLGKERLHGQLLTVNAQASEGSNNGLPSFSARIEVKKLTSAQSNLIKVGMSASIELIPEKKRKILIPATAILQEKGGYFVKLKDLKGNWIERQITPGDLSEDMIVVESGLKEGEVVAYG